MTAHLTPPPWHDTLWRHMQHAIHTGRVAHALLVCGAPGVGKRLFAQRLTQALLCRQRDAGGDACGQCPACRQYAAGTHPDLSRLAPEDTGKLIKVDQVRVFGHALTLTPQYASGRIGWIEPAEQLSISAANSLLKTLEEPPDGARLVLISDRASALMATIRSRCQHWQVPPAAPAAGQAWLAENGIEVAKIGHDGLRVPLTLIEREQRGYSELMAEWDRDLAALLAGRADAVDIAEQAAAQPPDLWLDWLWRRANTLLTAALAGRESVDNEPVPAQLIDAAVTIRPAVFRRWCGRISDSARLSHTNADWRLVVESILLHLQQDVSAEPHR